MGDVKVKLDKNWITIDGEKDSEEEVVDKNMRRTERVHGSVHRRFRFSSPVMVTENMLPWAFRDMVDMMDEMREPLILGFDRSPWETTRVAGRLASMDVEEKDDKFVLTCELPGFESKDVKVKLDKNWITIDGEKDSEEEVVDKNMRRTERVHGSV